MEKREPSHTLGGNVNWYCHYTEQYGCFSHVELKFFKKMIQMNIFTKQKHTYRYRKQTYGYQRVNVVGGRVDKSGTWDEHTLITIS